jgi:hypothetical protein
MQLRHVLPALLAALPGFAAEPAPPPLLKGDKIETTVNRAVTFLLNNQDRDGSINDPDKRHSHNLAMTALSTMAMAAVGHQPGDQTREGAAMRKAVEFLLKPDPQGRDREGYFGNNDGSRMYGHGIITLALTELLGMGVDKNQDRLLRERSAKAVELILRSQRVRKYDNRFEGGWRYSPDSGDADLSVTVWQVMALRSAHNASLPVPKEAIDNAVAYLKRSYESRRDADGTPLNLKSGCSYQPGQSPRYATAAAGLLALQVCGQYNVPEVIGSAEWLREKDVNFDERWFFYGTYYYAQGMQKRGGEFAKVAQLNAEKILLAKQLPEGSWYGSDGQERVAGKVYCTALAVLSLSVKYHFLPIYQH